MTQGKDSHVPSRYDAFISYRHRPTDQSVTELLHKTLEDFRAPKGKGMPQKRKGFAVFIDKWELVGNPNLNQMIQNAVKSADCFFLICSTTTPQSDWIQEELEGFTSKNGWERVYPILIEGTPKESFPKEVFARKQKPYTDFLNITADTATEVLNNLKREKLWYTSRLLGIPEEQLDSATRKRNIRRLMTWGIAGALALAVFAYGVTSFMRSAQQSRDAALASGQQAVENENRAIQSQQEASESERQANLSRQAAVKSQQEAEKNQKQAEENEEQAAKNEEEAQSSQQAYEQELMKVEEAQKRLSENEIWAQIAQYEDDLLHYRTLQARSYAKALLQQPDITPEQAEALQAVIDTSYGEGHIVPIYREEGLRFAGYSPDGQTLIIYGGDGALFSYEASSLTLLGQNTAGNPNTQKIAFSSDSQYIATCNFNEEAAVSMFETRTLRRVQQQAIVGDNHHVEQVSFAPHTHNLYYSFRYGSFMRMTPESVEIIDYPALTHFATVLPVNDEVFIASRYAPYMTPRSIPFQDGPIGFAYNIQTGDVTELGKIGDSPIYHNVFVESNDGRWLAVGGNSDTVNLYVFDRQDGSIVWHSGQIEQSAAMIDFSTDGTRMLYGKRFGNMDVYDMKRKFKITDTISSTSRRDVQAIQFCLNDTAVLYAYGTTLVLVDIETNQVLQRRQTPHSSQITGIEVSPDGMQAVSRSDVDLMVWELNALTGKGE